MPSPTRTPHPKKAHLDDGGEAGAQRAPEQRVPRGPDQQLLPGTLRDRADGAEALGELGTPKTTPNTPLKTPKALGELGVTPKQPQIPLTALE